MKQKFFILMFIAIFIIAWWETDAMADTKVSGIINSNTTWSLSGSPYSLQNTVQVANGATLTIEPGVVINGNDYDLQIFGNLNAIGTSNSNIIFNNVHITPGSTPPSQRFQITVQYSQITGGSIYKPTGYAIYGSLILRDSILSGTTEHIYVWYPVADCYIERNIFTGADGISTGHINGIKVYIRNNAFYDYHQCFHATPITICAISNWAAYDTSETIVEKNSFYDTTKVALLLPPGYNSVKLAAVNNYWNTTDPSIISSMIYDKTRDLNSGGYITFNPFLSLPDPNTPVLQCSYQISSSSQTMSATGGVGSVTITSSPRSCIWSATSNASWITITSGSTGTGSGTVNYSVSANTSTSPRTGTLTVAGRSFSVAQSGVTPYTLTINKTGNGTVTSDPSGVNCGSTCSASFNSGAVVTLTATPETGYSFTGWSGGGCSGTGVCLLSVSNSATVNATFAITQSNFGDVTADNWSFNYIETLSINGITKGCGNGDYCPSMNVTRGQMAAFIIRALYGENFTPNSQTSYFDDVPSTNPFFKYVQKLKELGITTASGTYNVDSNVTRSQMAAFLVRARQVKNGQAPESFTYTPGPYFSDVPAGDTFFSYVQKLKDDGITTVTGTYNASGNVTRDQMAAFICRAFLGMQ